MLNTPAGIPVRSAARMIASATRSAVAMWPLWALNTTGQPAASADGGIAARGGERQGEVARAEHRHRAQADAVLAQVRAWQRLAIRQCLVDARAVEIAATQHRGEQPHLPAGAAALAFDTRSGQRGFTADQFDEGIAQRVQLIGDCVEELRAARCTQGAVRRVSRCRGLGGGVDFLRGGLVEILGKASPVAASTLCSLRLPLALRWPPM